MAVPQPPKPQYVDRPDLLETFVDNVRAVTFDGATVRAELCVTRIEEGAAQAAVARQYPAARLVLRPDAAVDLFVRLQRLIALMEQRGIIKREQAASPAAASPAAAAPDALENPLGKSPKASK